MAAMECGRQGMLRAANIICVDFHFFVEQCRRGVPAVDFLYVHQPSLELDGRFLTCVGSKEIFELPPRAEISGIAPLHADGPAHVDSLCVV